MSWVVGFYDVKGLFQPKLFRDSMKRSEMEARDESDKILYFIVIQLIQNW